MTIIVGIICKSAIVLASDSQTTSGTAKRCDTNKITLVEFANVNVLVAQAGYATYSGRAIEILTGLAQGKEITDSRMVMDLAEKAMRQLKDEVRFQQGDCTMEELRDFVWKHEMGCELMIAYFFEGKPCLYTLDMIIGVSNKVNSHYEAIGCAASLGIYLLKETAKRDRGVRATSAIALYVIEKCKQNDAFCGGAAKMGVLYEKNNQHFLFSPKAIEVLTQEISRIDDAAKGDLDNQVQKVMDSFSKKMKEINDENK